MPRGTPIATLALLAAAACTPREFVWDEAGEPLLARYLASFHAAAGTRFVDSLTRAELVGRLRGERVLWLGDNHQCGELHALQRELLADLQAAGVRLAFALEAIGSGDEPAVDRFLRGESSLPRLRAEMRTRWDGSWLDAEQLDPAHYRALLTFARRHGIPVAALEPTPRLPIAQRDPVIAATVRSLARRWPDRLLVVHVGQAHLAGDGDLVARTALGGFVFGATPPPALAAAAPTQSPAGAVWRSDGGLWWFGGRIATGAQRGAAAAADRFATWPRMSSDATR